MLRAAVSQTVLHTTALLVYPFAIVLFFPLPWVYGVYQSLTVLENGEPRPIGDAVRDAMAEVRRWHGQHASILWLASPAAFVFVVGFALVLVPVLSGLGPSGAVNEVSVFGLVFFTSILLLVVAPAACMAALNIAGLGVLALKLGEGLAGMDVALLAVPGALRSTTGLALIAAVVFLAMDPVAKAAYVVRCHYGQALHTGEDLRIRLRRAAGRTPLVVMAGVTVALWTLFCPAAMAEEADDDDVSRTVAPVALKEAITEESAKPHFTWRMPRDRRERSEEGWFSRRVREPLERLRDALVGFVRRIGKAIESFFDWIFDRNRPAPSGTLLPFRAVARVTLVILAVVLGAVLVFFFYRTWRLRHAETPRVAEAVPAVPNLADEDTLADALPENEWVTMARGMVAEGNYRLAARALFLALLSRLAENGYIAIARYKSNLDYAAELQSRAHADGRDVNDVFRASTRVFEAVWYGDHEARQEHVDHLWRHQERLRSHAR